MLGKVGQLVFLSWKNHPIQRYRLFPQASDAIKVSEYLHATYGEHGLNMEIDPPVFVCRKKESLISEASRVIGDLLPKGPWPFDGKPSNAKRGLVVIDWINMSALDMPHIIRYSFDPALSKARLTRLRMQAIDAWLRLILSEDWN